MLKNSLRNDWFLILLLVALFGVGLTALYSAGGEERFLIQLRRGIIGILLMLALSYLPLPWLKHGGVVAFFFTFLMLIAVLFVGVKINNARRWLDLGFHIQPSELMKILLPIGLAYAYTLLKDLRWWHHLAALAAVSLPILLVLKQPDFGTSVLIALGGFSTVFFAGIRWAWIGGFSLMAVGSLPLLWNFVLKPYQQKRVLTLLDPYQDPLGAGYHTIQSQIAVGSGGLWGKGFNAGSQAQLGFLPERHTDFIFAVYAEEFGLIGSISLLALALLITYRCLIIAGNSGDRFCVCVIGGIITTFFLTFAINLSMVSGLLPIVGMPLPLVSYGGTALLATFAGFGVILAIARHQPHPARR